MLKFIKKFNSYNNYSVLKFHLLFFFYFLILFNLILIYFIEFILLNSIELNFSYYLYRYFDLNFITIINHL